MTQVWGLGEKSRRGQCKVLVGYLGAADPDAEFTPPAHAPAPVSKCNIQGSRAKWAKNNLRAICLAGTGGGG